MTIGRLPLSAPPTVSHVTNPKSPLTSTSTYVVISVAAIVLPACCSWVSSVAIIVIRRIERSLLAAAAVALLSMGCTFAKNEDANSTDRTRAKGGKSGGGGDLDNIPAPAPVDPRLPLTARQRFSIGKSWKGIARAMEPTGVHMFVALFEEHSELLDLFTKFRELRTREAQTESLELQQHAGLVMQTLDESISALENVDYFFDYLHQVGRQHYKVPGFKKEYFWKIEKPFLCAVKETLGERYTENIESIYVIVIHLILETLVKGYESAEGSGPAPK